MKKFLYFLLVLACIVSKESFAQSIYGRWEGISSGGEFLQINLVKDGDGVCGYTFDYDIRMPSSFCRANFRGYFDKERSAWVIVGTSFIQNSGSHVLMYITLYRSNNDESNSLRGSIDTRSAAMSMFGLGDGVDRILLKKVALEPAKINGLPFSCPEPPVRPKLPAKPPKDIEQPKVIDPPSPPVSQALPKRSKPPVKVLPKKPLPPIAKNKPAKTTRPVVKEKVKIDTIKRDSVIKPKPIQKQQQQPEIKSSALREMQSRKKTEFSRIVVHDRNISLKVYDNGVVDNDSVSIFYNGRLMVAHRKLSEEPLILNLELDSDRDIHELVMFAENLGTIPPNTALIVVTTADNRYELRSSASLTENAVLTFEYKPK